MMTSVCLECNNTGTKTDFAVGIGPYEADCKCHEPCPECKGTGGGKIQFAKGIGPYPTDCKKCKGKGKIPRKSILM